MSNERKAELLSILKSEIDYSMIAIAKCNTDEEIQFVNFELKRLVADLNYSINYYKEHK